VTDRKPFDHNEYYGDINDRLAEATGGKSSRVIKPVLDEEEAKKNKRPPEQKTATYRIGQDLKDRVDELTESYGVEKGSFVKALLIYALDELQAGSWELPPPTAGKRKLNV
jgi:hypothetical protein